MEGTHSKQTQILFGDNILGHQRYFLISNHSWMTAMSSFTSKS